MNRRRFIALSAAATATTAVGAPEDPKEITFAVLTDVQYADIPPEGERHYRESIPKLKAAVAEIAKAKPAFTLHLGDCIDRNFASYATVLPLFAPLGQPVRHLLGNHDYTVADAEKAKVPATLGMPNDHYAFHSGGLRVVMLDTTELAPYKHPAGSPEEKAATEALKRLAATGAANAQPWCGGISKAQLDWLERELAAADAAGERAIVCGHHPLLPADGHEIWNAAEVIAALERHPCVIAWFNGHNHAGAEAVRRGIPYLTFKSILHEPGKTAYALVTVKPDKLEIAGTGREKSRSYPLVQRKP